MANSPDPLSGRQSWNPSSYSFSGPSPTPSTPSFTMAPPPIPSCRDPIPFSYGAPIMNNPVPPPSFQSPAHFTPPPPSFSAPFSGFSRPMPSVPPPAPSSYYPPSLTGRIERFNASNLSAPLPLPLVSPVLLSTPNPLINYSSNSSPAMPSMLPNAIINLPPPPDLSISYPIPARPAPSSRPMEIPAFSASLPQFQTPSLSERAHFVSSPNLQLAIPPQSSWIPLSFSMDRPSILTSNILGTAGFSFPEHRPTHFTFKMDEKIHQNYQKKLEETTKAIYLMMAPPEKPFTAWQTMSAPPLVVKIDRNTNLIVDHAVLSDFFQRATPTQQQVVQAQLARFMNQRDQVGSQFNQLTIYNKTQQSSHISEAVQRPSSTSTSITGLAPQFIQAVGEIHLVVKYGGIFIKNALEIMEVAKWLIHVPRGPILNQNFSEVWQKDIVPHIHEKIDQLAGTNMKGDFDPKMDHKAVQVAQDILINPLLFVPVGVIIKAEKTAALGIKITAREGITAATIMTGRVSAAEKVVMACEKVESTINCEWVLTKKGGALINGRWYVEHALERMAPRTPQVMAELERRFLERSKVASQRLHPEELRKWRLENAPNPRGIPPSVVEAEIAQPGSTGVRVVLNKKGHVVTVIPGAQ